MPRIFDNIDQQLLPALCQTLRVADRADFCVGYFNLRGWRALDSHVERWSGGDGHCCRLLVGMQRLPQEELRDALRLVKINGLDNQTALRMKRQLAEEFRNQLMAGCPTNEDEAGLRRLAAQIKADKVRVKLFLRHPLHAKLYLLFRPDPINPIVAYLGSSNLTMAGLAAQGELNVDVLDHDATQKLAAWFNDRWGDRWCIDISAELLATIDESWAREQLPAPYHVDNFRLHAKVLSISRAIRELPDIPARFRLVLIDESHNLRNREGKTYRAIHEYIQTSASRCILLTATPYNKTYLDLSSQLRLFVADDKDIGIRPERLLREVTETEFIRRHQCPVRSLAAFEKSEHPEDWQELMRLYLVRRTRSFIQENYAEVECVGCGRGIKATKKTCNHCGKRKPKDGRKFLTFQDGSRSYFPVRLPKTVRFEIDDSNPEDQYARLYSDNAVRVINGLGLPRYGLGNYVSPSPHEPPTQAEARQIQGLSRAGKRLMGFCRTNLFKRLESSGQAFIQSVSRHILRNFVFLHAIENGELIPIGTQDAELLDPRYFDEDVVAGDLFGDEDAENGQTEAVGSLITEADYRSRAAEVYARYAGPHKNRFKWLRPSLFVDTLAKDLLKDARSLIRFLKTCGPWDASQDTKLAALLALLTITYPNQKVQVTRSVHEHILIFTDSWRNTQVWQWVKREVGRPTACREHTFHRSQPGDSLIQKLSAIEFTLEEEENLTIVDVAGRTRAAFDVERLTRRFYDRFKTEHAAFLKFVKGIPVQEDCQWYASLMLNRLVFIYFIQKKGFLDGDPDYLRNRLEWVRNRRGKDKFLSFYRHFLLRLFHEGLGAPHEGNRELDELLGKVPFLNVGLFDVHRLEEQNPEIAFPDKAFERLFDFFDAYQWHLDERPLRADNEINPDVLGYIFEKYINQKQMGAYYTKEDITGYIAQNTVIPFLFDAAEKKCPAAFQPDSPLWQLLREDPDRYIYAAVRHGVDVPLPKAIAAGLDNVSKRDGWNQAAPGEFALPTETWREHVARRTRCQELRRKLAAGEVHSINDLITLNLDIRQFAQDAVENCGTPDLLRALYRAICSVSVLDPTCGSGAFLFAALNILEPLYDACLERMQAFLEELWSPSETGAGAGRVAPVGQVGAYEPDATSADWLAAEEQAADFPRRRRAVPSATSTRPPAEGGPEARTARRKPFSDFRRTLAEVAKHPSPRYFVLKSIIIGNLYGVDIMEEAAEICKLRLFLKLVAQVDRLEQIEPLPDVDFNIRAGNTLVGYVSLDEIRRAIERERGGQKKLAFSDAQEDVQAIEEKALIADRAYQKFREMQTQHGMDASLFTEAKRELRRRLDALAQELDQYLAGEYGVAARNRKAYEAWRKSHQPFHWFAEFYGIMHRGGFDVIIGNPPYVEYSKVRRTYRVLQMDTEACGNLYAMCVEQSYRLLTEHGRFGFIVQAPVVSTQRMSSVRRLLCQQSNSLWYSTYDDRPSKLFDGMHHARLAIILSRVNRRTKAAVVATTRYHKWYKDEREQLFATVEYLLLPSTCCQDIIPKFRCQDELQIFQKLESQPTRLSELFSPEPTKWSIYYKITGVGHWFAFTLAAPKFWRDGVEGSSTRESTVSFRQQLARDTAFCCLSSSLHYWIYQARTNCRDYNPSDIAYLPIPLTVAAGLPEFEDISKQIMKRLEQTSELGSATYNVGGAVSFQKFKPKTAKALFDEVDRVLGKQYLFTDEELDFIINYDIKYRMGQDGGEEEG